MSSPSSPDPAAGPRRGLRPAKRAAITRAARDVFGRDGYARASIDAIATEAAVSTRTIYKHFAGKEQLFASVLEASATEVAEGFVARVAATWTGEDTEADLVALGHALAGQQLDFPEHFAMVRQIGPEAAHFPARVLEAWREAGPLRVEREVAARLDELAARGAIRLADRRRAAHHLIALTTIELTIRSPLERERPARAEIAESIAAGVRAFLDGYAARP